MKYAEPQPVSKTMAEHVFASGSAREICQALIGVTFFEPDWRWVENHCLSFLAHPCRDVRGLAATCLGHLARIHRRIDLDVAVPALTRLSRDPEVGGRAEDALDDIATFVTGQRPADSAAEPDHAD